MKKIIQVCSLLSLLILTGAVSSFAQNGFGSEVEIPFAFNVGDQSYEAGSYIVKLQKLPSGSATLSISDTKSDDVQTVLLNGTGDRIGTEIKLVFDSIEGRRHLTKVRTPDRTFALLRTKAERDAAKAGSTERPVDSIGTSNLF